MLALDFATLSTSTGVAVGALLGVYEVVVRAYPTVKNYSLVGKIINVLQFVSDFLNVKKSA